MLAVGTACLILAMGVCWMLTPAIIWLARHLDALDRPGGRKVHLRPIPRIGGLAVFLGFVAGLAFAAWVSGTLWTVPAVSVYWRGLAFAATGMLLAGLIDDIWGLSFHWKFAAQIAAAIYVWSCGFRIDLFALPLSLEDYTLGLLSLPLTVLWIVGITNAVNLIDGLDGLAAGIALITTSTVAVIAFARGDLGVTAASVALAGSLIGFLLHNFNPARIFLGDSGSMFLGFVLAVTSVRGSQKGPTAVAIVVPLLMLGLPLLDTSLAVARRIYRLGSEGKQTDSAVRYFARNVKQLFMPDRDHIHHRLLDLGLSHRRAVGVLYSVGVLFAASAFALVLLRDVWLASLLIAVLSLLMTGFLMVLYLRVARVRAVGRPAEEPASRPLTTPSRSQSR
jgi:UDP-GlcNAc:undecaprenyl-phosphate GlcNAc-1-phosphate transferase